MFRIKKDLFKDKMKNAEIVMGRIKIKSEQIYKKLEKDVRKMKKSNVIIEDNLKKALDDKSKESTQQMNILERNAKLHHVLQEDFKSKGFLDDNKKKSATRQSKRNGSPTKLALEPLQMSRTAGNSLEKFKEISNDYATSQQK